MISELKKNLFLDNMAKNFHGIKENVEPPYYSFSHAGIKRKKNITDADFFKNLHKAFYTFWHSDTSENILNNHVVRQEDLNQQIVSNALTFLFQTLSLADFKILVNVFEKIVNDEYIYGDTDFYRSILLNCVDCDYISENKQKIEYVCQSPILTKKDNVCDRFTSEVFLEETFNEGIFMADFYGNLLRKSWLVMSKFHGNSDIINNFYPDNKWQLLCNDNINLFFPEKIKLSIEKIDSAVFIKKFGILLLAELQENIKPARLKNKIHDLLKNHINDKQKKLFFFCSLASLNIDSFKELKKIYPGISEKISYDNIKNFNVLEYVERRIIKNRYTSDFIKIAEQYGIEDVSTDKEVIRENVWQILQYENIPVIKAELNKNINVNKKSKLLNSQKRI